MYFCAVGTELETHDLVCLVTMLVRSWRAFQVSALSGAYFQHCPLPPPPRSLSSLLYHYSTATHVEGWKVIYERGLIGSAIGDYRFL